jgi:hypothetical protein
MSSSYKGRPVARDPRSRVQQMKGSPLPVGTGRMNCPDCGATAAATGEGKPIVLNHKDGCPQKEENGNEA